MKRINLLPAQAKRSGMRYAPEAYDFSFFFRIIFIAFVLIFSAVSLSQFVFIKYYDRRLGILKVELARFTDRTREIRFEYGRLQEKNAITANDIQGMEEKIAFLQIRKSEKVYFSSAFVALSGLVLEDLWINKISVGDQNFTLTGQTKKTNFVSDFMLKLNQSGYFIDTGLTYTRQDEKSKTKGDENVSFEIFGRIDLQKLRENP